MHTECINDNTELKLIQMHFNKKYSDDSNDSVDELSESLKGLHSPSKAKTYRPDSW